MDTPARYIGVSGPQRRYAYCAQLWQSKRSFTPKLMQLPLLSPCALWSTTSVFMPMERESLFPPQKSRTASPR